MSISIIEADGLVLNTQDHGESDQIVTLFCQNIGRTTAIAKGAKKSKKRFVNKLELFTFLHLHLRKKNPRSLALLEEADLHSAFINIRSDLKQYTAASVIREFFLMATREGESDDQLYSLLLWSIHSLDKKSPHLEIVMIFLLRFFNHIGYRPELHSCNSCGAESSNHDRTLSFSISSGGLLCSNCIRAGGQSGIKLSIRTIKLMQACQESGLENLSRLNIPEQNLYEALNVLHKYGRHILQRDIISWKMLRKTA